MSARSTPRPAAPRPRSRGGSTFRDTLIIAGVAVAGVVGLVIWDGGDPPAVAGPGGTVPGGPGGSLTDPSLSGSAGMSSAESDSPVAAVTTAPADAAATAGPAVAAADPSSAGGDAAEYEAAVGMQDSLIALLPVPAGATEVPPDGAGIRTWTVPGTDWQAVRDAYLPALIGAGYTFVLTEAIDDGTGVGELYALSHSSGATLELGVGLADGQSIVEVTRR